MSDKDIMNKSLKAFSEEFGKVLDPVAFLNEKNPKLCTAFLKLHELTMNDGVVSKKYMHITGALEAKASEQELLETAFTLIPVAGMPSFAVFLEAWRKTRKVKL